MKFKESFLNVEFRNTFRGLQTCLRFATILFIYWMLGISIALQNRSQSYVSLANVLGDEHQQRRRRFVNGSLHDGAGQQRLAQARQGCSRYFSGCGAEHSRR